MLRSTTAAQRWRSPPARSRRQGCSRMLPAAPKSSPCRTRPSRLLSRHQKSCAVPRARPAGRPGGARLSTQRAAGRRYASPAPGQHAEMERLARSPRRRAPCWRCLCLFIAPPRTGVKPLPGGGSLTRRTAAHVTPLLPIARFVSVRAIIREALGHEAAALQ